MFGDTDLSNPEQVENVRHSIAMLQPCALAMHREPALAALDHLLALLRHTGPQPADLVRRVLQGEPQVHRTGIADR